MLGVRSRFGIWMRPVESHTYLLNVPNNLTGAFYVIVQSDSEQQVAESDNANNARSSASPAK